MGTFNISFVMISSRFIPKKFRSVLIIIILATSFLVNRLLLFGDRWREIRAPRGGTRKGFSRHVYVFHASVGMAHAPSRVAGNFRRY